uniref:Insulin-like domain-containing protein n=1 Tax=Anopheles epiroticus TaxID=199890 RepID=A0A182P8E5_9DIPT
MPSKGSQHLRLMVSCGATLLLLVLLSVSVVNGSMQYVESGSQRKAHYCGTKLSDTLAKLCNRFNGFRKKADIIPMVPYPEARLLDEVEHNVEQLHTLNDRSSDMIYQALMTLQHLNSHGNNFRRVRRQVVAECCYQSCTLDTLKSYCAD